MLLYKIGRVLQVSGMLVLPFAIVGELMQRITLGASLKLSSVGIGLFAAGWLLQQVGKPK